MKKILLKIGKWSLWLLLFLFFLAALDVAVLAFPYPLFPNKVEYRNLALYSDGDLDSGYVEILSEAWQRHSALETFRPDHNYRIFLCNSPRLYSFFAFLCRKYSQTQGIGLSLLSNMYISETQVANWKSLAPSEPTYSLLDGNLAGVIAHELGHFDVIGTLGFWTGISLPFWKSEGYAEYAANIGAARAVSEYDLKNRIALLYDNNFWCDRSTFTYSMYESQLMIEFLHDIKGFDFETIMSPEVTSQMVLKEMYGWYNAD